MVHRHHLHSPGARFRLSDSHHRLVQPLHCWLGGGRYPGHPDGHCRRKEGSPYSKAADSQLRPRMPVHQQGVQGFPQGTQDPPEHGWQEPLGRQHQD